MKFALIADVHGNLEALDAVLRDIRARCPDARIVCAGDVVGYGPEPEACIARLREFDIACVIGNHEEMVLGRRDYSRCGYAGIVGARYAARVLSPEALDWIDGLPASLPVSSKTVVCHGDLEDADTYLSNDRIARRALEQLAERHPGARFLVCGHTHHAACCSDDMAYRVMSAGAALEAGDDERWVINPGAVGQSRDGSCVARYAVLDEDAARVSWHGVAYEYQRTVGKMRDAGLVATVDLQKPAGIRRVWEGIRRRVAKLGIRG